MNRTFKRKVVTNLNLNMSLLWKTILDSAVIVAQKHFQYSVEKKNILGF